MRKDFKLKSVKRILDANINRLKEGIRVCEEICRFALKSPAATQELKRLRHAVDRSIKRLPLKGLIRARDSGKDIGRRIYANELKRNSLSDILFANIQRAKESLRVLEEFTKLVDKKAAVEFKEIRYFLYATEKKIAGKVAALGGLNKK